MFSDEALGDQILEYLDTNWSTLLDDDDKHALAAGLSNHLLNRGQA